LLVVNLLGLAFVTLRAVLGKHELDALLSERDRLNLDVQKILDWIRNGAPNN
jgi:regulator of protease activity HflC (stomatin/prohibitin superfamily)